MKLPTFAGLTTATRVVITRFPESLLAGVVSAIVAMFVVRGGHDETFGPIWAAAGLAIPLFFVAAMLSEELRPERVGRFDRSRLLLDLLVCAAVVAFALAWQGWGEYARLHRLIQFALAALLCAAFAPFVRRHEANAFWQWNRALFVRFVVGGLFSVVLFGGLAIAIAAMKPLFGLQVPERTIFDLWLTVVFVFQPTYVFAGVPRDFDALAEDRDYPIVLRVFAQYLLVPLVALYLVILTVYLVKVLVTGQWPNGWIGWLVSSVSAAGLLAILLVHPVRDRDENRWIDTFTRWFFVLLLPAVGMLFAAIGKRIGQYGVTEERYDLFALAAWVTLVAVGYSWRRRADIRWIPMSLCAVALLTSFGPWGAYSVSRFDQTKRVLALVAELDVRPDGTPSNAAKLDFAARKKLSDAVRYLAGTHGVAALPAPLLAAAERDPGWKALSAKARNDGENAAQAVMAGLGQGYVTRWDTVEIRPFEFRANNGAPEEESLVGFTRLVRLKSFPAGEFGPESSGVRVKFDSRSRLLTLEDQKGGRWTFAFDSLIAAAIESGSTAGPLRSAVRLEPASGTSRARLLLRELDGQQQADTIAVDRLDADVLLAK
ncbi:MAG: DUF4153 domain-containing protein [Candidatus Eisenbacteria bacterium]|nr:DUF4153 domain-containing protein [Candidatus Eisenbacteria bacterium]